MIDRRRALHLFLGGLLAGSGFTAAISFAIGAFTGC